MCDNDNTLTAVTVALGQLLLGLTAAAIQKTSGKQTGKYTNADQNYVIYGNSHNVSWLT
jgi:hypothetical protein